MAASDAVRAVYSAALADPALNERLHAEPENVGREMGLNGAELAELVGSERYRASGQQRSHWTSQVLVNVVQHSQGRPWPFADLSTAEIADRAAMAQVFCTRLYVSKGMGHERAAESFPSLTDLGAWAISLEEDIRRRADASDSVDPVLADALVQAINLVAAVRRVDV